MHFKEVAKSISEVFNKKTHVATTHNELIKDDRFILVGRGIYALKEWFPRLSEAIQKRFLKWVLKKDPQISGMVRLDMLREYGFDATGLAVIGKDTLYRAMWLILESEYDHLTQ
jgi:hypothetical protein